MMIRMSCRDLDSEDMYMQVRCNLIANTDTVANQIKEREDLENTKKKRERLLRFSAPAQAIPKAREASDFLLFS